MSKGLTTKDIILKSAFELTSKFGLESLSIGELAKTVGMSKSGLFSHFKSKEKLQMMVMDYAAQSFVDKVVRPAIEKERGIPRIRALMDNWKSWSSSYLPGGCPFLSAIVEFDDRPGKVRDHILNHQSTMIDTFERAVKVAQEEKQLGPSLNTEHIAYEIYSNMIGFHIYNRLLKNKAAEDMFEKTFQTILERSSV
ncbi:MAG: TetR/AcrR family transcriptional regulator [Bacteriovoracaceae bacterium]|nr:TetR/AcrR family transcriptional regulator [Bacteriovoracaceae bacterium]